MRSFGNVWGEKILTTSFESLVDGITTSQNVWVKPLSTNRGDIIVRSGELVGDGGGMRLEATENPIQMKLNFDNDSIQVRGSVDGCTVVYYGNTNSD